MKRFLIFLLLAPCSLLLTFAYEIEINGVYFGIMGTRFAYVTTRSFTDTEPCYAGDVIVPEQITYEGRTYNVLSVGSNAFTGCDGLTSVQLPSTVTAISPCAFLGCTGLRQVSLPQGLIVINNTSFAACTSLQQMSLPRHQEMVDSMTFYCCASLTSLILPHRIRTICCTAMQHLSSLTDLYCFASEPPVAEVGAFTLDDQKKCTLHVPRETLRKYQETQVWREFSNIVPLDDAEYEKQGYQRGDINDDGKVDVEDLELLRLIIVNLPDDSAVRWAADVNGDGKVNAMDYVALTSLQDSVPGK